ncbi:hypothetical protein B0H66DRAFT_345071 [Apodospora peruviana]|uniref:Uncharacterized protein n=1 Tax=Apodospora peruviana TaxID=516989 RepID=A0AAE0M1B0_9PEZI|nr:hypothetical protein B0H66DRAFT_345071 [Apodospora peruviana]
MRNEYSAVVLAIALLYIWLRCLQLSIILLPFCVSLRLGAPHQAAAVSPLWAADLYLMYLDIKVIQIYTKHQSPICSYWSFIHPHNIHILSHSPCTCLVKCLVQQTGHHLARTGPSTWSGLLSWGSI